MLAANPNCVHCLKLGRTTPATVADHQPPLRMHNHVAGSGCCILVASCKSHSQKQGGQISQASVRGKLETIADNGSADGVEIPPEPVGFGKDHPCWDVPWLKPLMKMPAEAVWPRFMTMPHPDAVDSYGANAIHFLKVECGITLRWWQQLVIVRELEHDVLGNLCFLDELLSTPRQSGKSIKLRASGTWRLHQADLFGEPQLVLHTAMNLPITDTVQKPARAWARARGYKVREENGNETITEPESGSEWVIKGRGSVYGYSSTLAMVDEGWGVDVGVVDDGIEPTMAERRSPQLHLASTAHRKATTLFPLRRATALEQLGEPVSTLIIEWSAPRGTPIEDRAAWRAASPHWSKTRERLLEARLNRVLAGETVDIDEADPVESFLCQYLNVWPVFTVPGAGERLLDTGVWGKHHTTGEERHGRIWISVESNYGVGASVAAVAEIGDDRFECDGWTCVDTDDAMAQAEALAAQHPLATIIVGASLIVKRRKIERAGAAETRFGLPLLRQLVAAGRLVHDECPELDGQLETCRVRPVSGGLALVSGQRADLVRGLVWALRAAVVRRPVPAIH